MYEMNEKNKSVAFNLELRQHRVSRLVTANDGLYSWFFLGATRPDYH